MEVLRFDKTEELYRAALELSRKLKGKILTVPKVPINSLEDFSLFYTPGVAAVSKEIAKDPDLSFELTGRWNTIAIVSDGTRVLGLGNIGPEAAIPVMEGKALIFKYLGGVNALPITIRVKDNAEFLSVIKALEPSFGGFNLEDIETPRCFFLLESLQKELKVPVWHDDQQGTAGATLAGLINALKLVGKKERDLIIVFYGAGASNIATVRVLSKAGFKLENMRVIDSKGVLHKEKKDLEKLKLENPWKYEVAIRTNADNVKDVPKAFEGADILIAASRPGPGVFPKEYISKMNKDPIVFLLANPVPEIWPWEAKEMGAKVVATGRSDFPNQINNSLVFPAVFRGALDARARSITDEMIIAVSQELARFAEENGMSEDHIIPTMEDWEVYPRAAAFAAVKAVEQGIARRKASWQKFYEEANEIIDEARKFIR